MTEFTEEEIDRLAKRVEEKIRARMVHMEIFAIREDMRRAFDSIEAKLDRCITLSKEAQEHLTRGEDDA